jgi:hypothetical protein
MAIIEPSLTVGLMPRSRLNNKEPFAYINIPCLTALKTQSLTLKSLSRRTSFHREEVGAT